MKFKTYYIKHTKSDFGADLYSIYKKYFGFISIPFRECDLYEGFFNKTYFKIQKVLFYYTTFENATNALNKYLNEPTITYKGHTLTRCTNDLWVDYKSGEICEYGNEYAIAGSYELCKERIDRFEEIKDYRKYKENIKLHYNYGNYEV